MDFASEETRQKFIKDNQHILAAAAWTGFQRSGRGLVLFQVTDKDMSLVLSGLDFCPIEILKQIGHSTVIELCSVYDPNTQAVLLIQDMHQGGDPEQYLHCFTPDPRPEECAATHGKFLDGLLPLVFD